MPRRDQRRWPAVDAATLARGAVAGVGATLAMTVVLVVARRLGLADPPAPEAVVTGALERVDLDEEVRPPTRTGLAAVGHLAYGAGLGAVFAAVDRGGRAPRLACGAAFGLAVWALSYAGWLPAAGIQPPPSRQGAGRHVERISSHLVYGASLAWLRARLRDGGDGHR